jgi:hypothetical protein
MTDTELQCCDAGGVVDPSDARPPPLERNLGRRIVEAAPD